MFLHYWLFNCYTLTAYSQVLTKNDIEIYIKNYYDLENFRVRNHRTNDNWRYYRYFNQDIRQHIWSFCKGRMTDSYFYREFISDYNYYLENLQIPAGLENKYRAIGWDQNGHKIFSTISSVMAYIYSLIEYEINGERKDRLYEKFIEIIGEEDLELISQNFERIDKFTGK